LGTEKSLAEKKILEISRKKEERNKKKIEKLRECEVRKKIPSLSIRKSKNSTVNKLTNVDKPMSEGNLKPSSSKIIKTNVLQKPSVNLINHFCGG